MKIKVDTNEVNNWKSKIDEIQIEIENTIKKTNKRNSLLDIGNFSAFINDFNKDLEEFYSQHDDQCKAIKTLKSSIASLLALEETDEGIGGTIKDFVIGKGEDEVAGKLIH